jgi:hypothetical protein
MNFCYLRWLLVLLVMSVVLVLLTGCQYGVPAERVLAMNAEWCRIYTLDRRMTEQEAKEYAALAPEAQAKWKEDGKPTPEPLSERLLDAMEDHRKAVQMEAEAAE